MLGLLACQISQTVKGMIGNFAHLIKVIFTHFLSPCFWSKSSSHSISGTWLDSERRANLFSLSFTASAFHSNGWPVYRKNKWYWIFKVSNSIQTKKLQVLHWYYYRRDCLEAMEMEFDYWVKFHFVTFTHDGECYEMARYHCSEDGPRPESYYEDFKVSSQQCSFFIAFRN